MASWAFPSSNGDYYGYPPTPRSITYLLVNKELIPGVIPLKTCDLIDSAGFSAGFPVGERFSRNAALLLL
jgi:hypothetical protein